LELALSVGCELPTKKNSGCELIILNLIKFREMPSTELKKLLISRIQVTDDDQILS
jgi:hypothetical protein